MGRSKCRNAAAPRRPKAPCDKYQPVINLKTGTAIGSSRDRRYSLPTTRCRNEPARAPIGLALALSDGANAQQADKIPRVGVLLNSPLTSPHYQAFVLGLHDLDYLQERRHCS
jgi:hypothetical protein